MPKLAAEHHHNAAEHLTQAAIHHKAAQSLQEQGRYKEAAHHAVLAHGHQHYANVYATEANKAYMDVHGVQSRSLGG